MCGNTFVQQQLATLAPNITRCMGGGNDPWAIVDRAIKLGCKKVQLFGNKWDEGMVKKAKEHGIICNFFYSDDVEKAKWAFEIGVDTVLTNDYQTIFHGTKDYIEELRKNRKAEDK